MLQYMFLTPKAVPLCKTSWKGTFVHSEQVNFANAQNPKLNISISQVVC